MNVIRTILRTIACLPLLAALTGCGAWQSVKDTTADATDAVFITKVKQMNLVIASRSALNQDEGGMSLPVVLRIYQLKASKAFETATYAQLLAGTSDTLKVDILARAEITLAPSATARLSQPMAADTQYIGVVAFFPRSGERGMATVDSEGSMEESRSGEAHRRR